nr:M20/M25/M40 family metallo-hydrolase [Streptomyces sp. HNM0574]
MFSGADTELLLRLLEIPTVGPLEAGPGAGPSGIPAALRTYAAAAEDAGLEVVHHGPAAPHWLERPGVPAVVREAARARDGFLAEQPSLVLRLGPPRPAERTVMFNVHLDTVAGAEPVGFDGARFTGRGAVDAKGPAVALLAGLRAVAQLPGAARESTVLVQAVAGEEGGAMGTFGTRPLLDAGHYGRLNVFCEPTGLRSVPRATASMTARITVDGEGAIDDRPDAGHNATVLLGHLATHLAARLDRAAPGGRLCVAGLHTGGAHNRVYGTGTLLLNLSYGTAAEGELLAEAVEREYAAGLKDFADAFAGTREFAHTAASAARVTRLTWDKRGLPALRSGDPWAERLLARAGARAAPADDPGFTCDAIWAAGLPGTFTTVLGPGSLDLNHAHAEGEFVDLADLEEFAALVTRLVTGFATDRPPETDPTDRTTFADERPSV